MHLDTHLYCREINPESGDVLSLICQSIRPDSVVLDVGCGSGALGRYLSLSRNCVVDGITLNPAEAELASAAYRTVKVADLEAKNPSQLLEAAKYDFVVCADVLEHLRNCNEILRDLGNMLRTGGRILVSVPNVTYLGLVANLLGGRFSRTHEGLLDATHVRFFDRRALDELASECGMAIVALHRVQKDLVDTEFRYIDLDLLPAQLKSSLLAIPEGMVYEYVMELVPSNSTEHSGRNHPLPNYAPSGFEASFETQVFFDIGEGFREIDSRRQLTQTGSMHDVVVTGPNANHLHRLRLDFADRPGLFEVECVTLSIGDAKPVWHWQCDWSGDFVLNALEILPERGLCGGRLFLAKDHDPWLALRFEPPLQLNGGAPRVKICMTGPQRYEGVAFSWAMRRIEEDRDQLTRLRDIVEELATDRGLIEARPGSRLSEVQAELSRTQRVLDDVLSSPFKRTRARLGWLLRRVWKAN